MGDVTGIAWSDATFNPVWGCTKVSPACDFCYAEGVASRFAAGSWGPQGVFREFGDKHWDAPRRWDAAAALAGTRKRVFCASMADVFDNRWPDGIRERLWSLIRDTPHLDWQLLTKRPQNIRKMLPGDWGNGWSNVWLGITAENQLELNRRWPHLDAIPARIRFMSCEPLLEPLALPDARDRLHWIIVGGESGTRARPTSYQAVLDVLDQASDIGAAAFMKQAGSRRGPDWPAGITGKGDTVTEWPPALWLQEFPA